MEEELEFKLESEIKDIMERVDAILKKIEVIDSVDYKRRGNEQGNHALSD